MRLLDLFCGRWGWSRAFAARGWECVGVDLERPDELPNGCQFLNMDVMNIRWRTFPVDHFNISQDKPNPFWEWCKPDFICASPPCQEFSVWGMRCFFPKPQYPANGIRLFNHAREICELSGIPYVLENVRAAERFVGAAAHHAGAFHLWGNGVPPLMPQGIVKGFKHGGIRQPDWPHDARGGAKAATIPPELANAVADYAERLCEARAKTTVVVNLEVST